MIVFRGDVYNDLFIWWSSRVPFHDCFTSRKSCFLKFKLIFLAFQKCRECCNCLFSFGASLSIRREFNLIFRFIFLSLRSYPMLFYIFDHIHIFRNIILKLWLAIYRFNGQAPLFCRAYDLLFVYEETQWLIFRLFSQLSFSRTTALILMLAISFR